MKNVLLENAVPNYISENNPLTCAMINSTHANNYLIMIFQSFVLSQSQLSAYAVGLPRLR